MQWRTGEASLIKVNGITTRTAFHRRPYRSCSTRTGSDRAWPPRKRSCSHVLLERHEVRAAGRGDMLDQEIEAVAHAALDRGSHPLRARAREADQDLPHASKAV
jgi:hypothetical protein